MADPYCGMNLDQEHRRFAMAHLNMWYFPAVHRAARFVSAHDQLGLS